MPGWQWLGLLFVGRRGEGGSDNPPGHGAAGTEDWAWKGGSWTVSIPAVAGRCALNVGQAMPPSEPYGLSATIARTRILAQITLQGRVAGEPEESSG
jgi:hypothetical protein